MKKKKIYLNKNEKRLKSMKSHYIPLRIITYVQIPKYRAKNFNTIQYVKNEMIQKCKIRNIQIYIFRTLCLQKLKYKCT